MPASTRTRRDQATATIAAELLSVARVMNQVRVHDTLCRQAGVELDRSGAALLYKLHTEGDNLRLTDLAERLGIDSPAVTRKVQLLERLGMLRRTPDPGDARASRLAVTPAGQHAIARLLEARRQWLQELLEAWSDADRAEFARLLGQFTATLSAGEASHGR